MSKQIENLTRNFPLKWEVEKKATTTTQNKVNHSHEYEKDPTANVIRKELEMTLVCTEEAHERLYKMSSQSIFS